MKITKTSPITGKTVTREINVTQDQLDRWRSGMLIQRAMPNLTPGEREFIKTGITDEEWDKATAEELDPRWTKTEDGYVTEASSFKDQPRIACPCGQETEYMTHVDFLGDVTHWTAVTPCCGKLTIFND